MPKRPFSNPFPERGVSLAFSLPSWFFADPRKQAESSCRLFSAQGFPGNCPLNFVLNGRLMHPQIGSLFEKKEENPPKKKCTKRDFFPLYGWLVSFPPSPCCEKAHLLITIGTADRTKIPKRPCMATRWGPYES